MKFFSCLIDRFIGHKERRAARKAARKARLESLSKPVDIDSLGDEMRDERYGLEAGRYEFDDEFLTNARNRD